MQMIFQVIRGSIDFHQLEYRSLIRRDFAYLLDHSIYGYERFFNKAYNDKHLGQIL